MCSASEIPVPLNENGSWRQENRVAWCTQRKDNKETLSQTRWKARIDPFECPLNSIRESWHGHARIHSHEHTHIYEPTYTHMYACTHTHILLLFFIYYFINVYVSMPACCVCTICGQGPKEAGRER